MNFLEKICSYRKYFVFLRPKLCLFVANKYFVVQII